MKLHICVLAICLFILLCRTPGLSQDNAIDNTRLDADIETVLNNALRSIDFEFDFNFEPPEIDLSDLNLELDALKSEFLYLDIDVDQELSDDLDINIDIDADDLKFNQGTSTDTDQHDDSDPAENNSEHHSEGKNDTSGKSPKYKGLKKIN
jgi:hypothetical protein